MKRPAKSVAQSVRNHGNGPVRVGEEPPALRDTFTRTMDGRITSWPSGMRRRYGFTRKQALGRNSHELLGTVFPLMLQDIEATLLAERRWRGGLIHYHADGRAVVVMEEWDLTAKPNGAAATVTEAHSDAMSTMFADLLAILANQLSQPLTAIGNYVNGARRSLGRNEPDPALLLGAMTLAAAQVVRSAQQLKMLRSMANDMRRIG